MSFEELRDAQEQVGAMKRSLYVLGLLRMEIEWARNHTWADVYDGIAVLKRLRALVEEM